jgi:hypothetical protein
LRGSAGFAPASQLLITVMRARDPQIVKEQKAERRLYGLQAVKVNAGE